MQIRSAAIFLLGLAWLVAAKQEDGDNSLRGAAPLVIQVRPPCVHAVAFQRVHFLTRHHTKRSLLDDVSLLDNSPTHSV